MKRIWIPEAPGLLRQRTRDTLIESPALEFEGRFRSVDLVHVRTGLIARHLEFDNLIVDAGLNALGTADANAVVMYCAVGTGSAEPAAGQLSLVSEVARTNSNGGTSDSNGVAPDNTYTWTRVTRVFTQAQANGNLTEIGFFRNSSGGPMWCRQLLRDAVGAPTTIVKTSEFELRVTYEYRVRVPGDRVYSTLVNGVSQNVTVRPSQFSAATWNPAEFGGLNSLTRSAYGQVYSGPIGTFTSLPSGTSYTMNSTVAATYVDGSNYRDLTATWNAATANNNLLSFQARMPGRDPQDPFKWQHQLTTAFTKTNTQRLDVVFRNSWARYIP